jgi:L-fuconolactonase
VTEVAQHDPRIKGIVAWAPLEKGDDVQEELAKLAANSLVKEIRRKIQFEEDPEFCLRPGFVRGVLSLAEHCLSFDICIRHWQMEVMLKLVRQCPDVPFIINHCAKPDIKAQQLDPWRQHLQEFAALPNVTCKMSGLVTEADLDNWTPDDLRPYIDHVVECFGFDRIIFGGDWPVAAQATDYPRWVSVLDNAFRGCSADELRKVYATNAEMFYRV